MKKRASTLFGTVAIALAIGGLAQPAVSNAKEWDVDKYDWCTRTNYGSALFCCVLSDGEWNINEGKCEAPAPAQPTQNPGGVGTGTADQTPDVGQAPAATPPPTAPQNPWGIDRGTRTQT